MRNLIIVKSINRCRILNIVGMLAYYYKEIPNMKYFTMLISSLVFNYNKEKKFNKNSNFSSYENGFWLLMVLKVYPKYCIKYHKQNREYFTHNKNS